MPQTNIYDVRHAENPTHIRTSYKDEIRKRAVVQTVYSGKIHVSHGAGDMPTTIAFQYPLIGFFRDNNNNGMVTPGIIPIDKDGGQEFLGTTAMAALTLITIKDDRCGGNVEDLHADLFRVDLAPTNLQVFAVVLTGTVSAWDFMVEAIDYHVTVLTGLSDRGNRFGTPILSNSADWNGTYGAINATPVLRGIPSEDFP